MIDRSTFRATVLTLLLGTFVTSFAAFADYSNPPDHPRLMLTSDRLPEVANRCKEGGTHRAYYTKLLAFADYVIGANKTNSRNLPCTALVYKIHKYWNDTGYQGGGFNENYYWQFTRDVLLNEGAWGSDWVGVEQAIAADWIWEKLRASEISACASLYGTPRTNFSDGSTWRTGTSYWVTQSMARSLLFIGSAVDNGNYSNEYQGISGYIENVYSNAMALSGGVGTNGGSYAVNNITNRIYAFENFTSGTGINIWTGNAYNWAKDHTPWIYYSTPPQRNVMELNQDHGILIWDPNWKNVALMAWRAQEPFNQFHTERHWETIQNNSISNYKNASIWLYVLYYDPTLAAADMSTAAKTRRMSPGGMDHVYMTTGLGDNNATWAYFEAGRYFYGHQHQDAGTFSICRKGDLIIDSGYYGQYRSTDGGWHASNYYHRSLAHNTLSVYDPDEKFYWGATSTSAGPVANDGGQIMPKSAPSMSEANSDSTYHPGKMIAYEANDEYTYCIGDLHNAYNREAHSESRNLPNHPNKIDTYTREFAYLRPDFFVVLDRVVSTNANFTKVWNLHVTASPQISGASEVQRAGDSQAGIWDYAGASLAKITDVEYGGGSLFLKSLLPQQRTMRKIGGRNREFGGYAYWTGGFDTNGKYDPTEGRNYYWGDWLSGHEHNEGIVEGRATPGWGRIEVEATVPSTDDLFLNVLYPVDASVNNIPETNLIETPDMVGAEIVNDRVILFARDVTAGVDSVSYTLAGYDTSALHMICNLDADATYRVFREGATVYIRKPGMTEPSGATELVTPAPSSSPAGVLAFWDDGTAVESPPGDINIGNVTAAYSGFGSFAVTITWTTDVPSDSQVEFGTSPSYGSVSTLDPTLVTNHSITLVEPEVLNDQTYYFRVVSNAPGANQAVSQGLQFGFDVVAPGKINDLRESN